MLLYLYEQIIKGKEFALNFFYVPRVGCLFDNSLFLFAALFIFGCRRVLLRNIVGIIFLFQKFQRHVIPPQSACKQISGRYYTSCRKRRL